MVNQVECNPGCQQKQTLAYCRDHGILVEAWSPLGSGRVLENATLQALGKQYMARIAALPPFGGSGHDPDQIAF